MTWVPYEPYEPPCSGQAMPGTRALADALLITFRDAYSLGIYNCRPPSIHGDGRAFDMGFEMVGGGANPRGHAAVQRVKAVADGLGVQEAIYDRTRWSAHYPDGIYYGGVSPHYDHVHFSQSKYAATYLTLPAALRLLESGLGGEDEEHHPIEDPDFEEPPVRYIHIVGEPADDNVYGYCDDEWWIATDEERTAGGGSRQVNARQRDVIRSRVLAVQAARKLRESPKLLFQIPDSETPERQYTILGAYRVHLGPGLKTALGLDDADLLPIPSDHPIARIPEPPPA